MRQQNSQLENCVYTILRGRRRFLIEAIYPSRIFMVFWCYCSECRRKWERLNSRKNIIFLLLLVHIRGDVLCSAVHSSTLESHKSIEEMEEWKTKSDFVSLLQLLCVCCSASMNSIHLLAPTLVVEIDRKKNFFCVVVMEKKVGGAHVGKVEIFRMSGIYVWSSNIFRYPEKRKYPTWATKWKIFLSFEFIQIDFLSCLVLVFIFIISEKNVFLFSVIADNNQN